MIVHNFASYLKNTGSIYQFQIRQEKIDEFNIILNVNEKYNKSSSNMIHNYFKNYIGENVKIEINIVDDIPLTSSGKRRYLIRNKDIELDF